MELFCAQCDSTLQVSAETVAESESIKCPSCGSMVHPSSELDSVAPTIVVGQGRQLAHFDLLRLLGTGHYGEVWRANDTRLGRDVAIKIPRGISIDLESVQQFVRESRANSKLSHPHIVPIYDVGEDNGRIYIVYKLIEGVTLKQFTATEKPNLESIIDILIKVCDALQHAHDRGILHRDVKPGNIMVDKNGEPYLTDFGMASSSEHSTEATQSGALKGTFAYMSPEIAAGRIREADGRSDQYAIGVILYEVLAGQRPFTGTIQQLLQQIVHDDPVFPNEVAASAPVELQSIALKALEKLPDNRYASCADLRDDLRRFLDGAEITAESTTRRIPERKPRIQMPSAKVFASIAGGVALGVCSFAAWFWLADGGFGSDSDGDSVATRPVSINTIPEGATLVFYPIHPVTGRPLADKGIRPKEKTPLRLKLEPADYLIVAVPDNDLAEHENYTFHEVVRRVPFRDAGLPERFKHAKWSLELDGTVCLPEISLPSSSVNNGMVLFKAKQDGARSDRVGENNVSPFLLETREVTLDDFKSLADGQSPVYMRKGRPIDASEIDDNAAVVFVSYDEALSYAEKAGKRLPTEAEFNFAATNGGTTKYPWGNDDGVMDDWKFGIPGIAEFDKSKTDPPVLGLFSNAGEWTMNHPAVVDDSKLDRTISTTELRVIKGIIPSQLNDAYIKRFGLNRDEVKRGPASVYLSGLRQVGLDRIGFRCARSKTPRLTSADFRP